MKQLLIVVLCALPATAFAGPKDEAKKHIEKATEAHQAQKYDVALGELQAAYQLDPQPDLLYAIGQVQVKLGNCPEAIQSYQKFLDTKPAAEPTAAANEAIKTCQDDLAKAQPPPPPPPEEPKALPPPPPPAPETRPFYADTIGDVLVGVGVVASVGGLVMYTSARGKLDDADKATTYGEQQALVDSAHSRRTLAVILGGVGVAALGAGIWHYTQHHEERAVAVVPTTSGGMVTWMGRF